jgi:hypothetical protein
MHHLLFWYSLVIPYHVLINYVVHSKLEWNLELQGFPCTSKSTIDNRASWIHWNKNVRVFTKFHHHYHTSRYLNFLNKGNDPFECKCQLFQLPFDFCWCRWKFSYGGWCHYALKSSSCTSLKGEAWRSTTWRECLSTITRKRIVQKNGAHSNWLFGMGSWIVS